MSVSVVSRSGRTGAGYPCFPSIKAALAEGRFEYAVVATETSDHWAALTALAETCRVEKLLVEKPLFGELPAVRPSSLGMVHVGYQLRFHPAIVRLRDLISARRCLQAELYVGQHLDGWRAGRAGRDTYSGQAAKGGGVLRDLSHELDLALWLFGDCQRLTAIGGRLSEVTADSDDAWSILAGFERCPVVSLQMNYLDRIGQRRIVVVADDTTVNVDLVRGTLECNGALESVASDRDRPFTDMHRAVLERGGQDVCGLEGGLRVMSIVDAVERAGETGTWIAP
jgi:predicted dehydrogenase